MLRDELFLISLEIHRSIFFWVKALHVTNEFSAELTQDSIVFVA